MTIIGTPVAGPSANRATLNTVVMRVYNLLGSEPSLTPLSELEALVQTRYEDLYESWGWSKRLRDFTIALIPQATDDGTDTVSVSFGNSLVTSIGTPFTEAIAGRQIAIGTHRQYFYVQFEDTSSLTLLDARDGNEVPWPADSASDVSWRIFQTVYQLPLDADGIVSLAGETPIEELDGGRDRLDNMDPDRTQTADHPTYWFYAGASGEIFDRDIEVWPIPTVGRILRGQYHRMAPILTSASGIDLPIPLLVYATAADACHLLHAKQGSMETMWENKALFFERKSEEARKRFEIRDLETTSPPTHLARSSRDKRSQFVGTDYEVSHQLDTP